MAESMVGMKRSHRCTEVTTAQIGQEVTVMGWVQKSRNKGGIIFVDFGTVPASCRLYLRKMTAERRTSPRRRS